MRVTILIFIMAGLCSCQLLGIDLGTMYTKVAMVQPGAGLSFGILENTKSERKIETAISFLNQHRFYEQEALSKRSKSTANSFLFTKMFIDMINNNSQTEKITKQYFLNHQIEADKQLVNFIVEEGFKDKLVISIEQIFGMIFKHIKDLAEKALPKVKVQDCVLTVPYDWSLNQRIIIINALKIAGLNPLYIVTENTAAAVHYGVNRQSNITHKVLFYNLGANYLELSVAEFKKGNGTSKKQPTQIYILGGYGANNVGGLSFDRIIMNKLHFSYQTKHKKELSNKGIVRLLAESKKIKQILSANKQAHVALQELDGIDFNLIVARKEFEYTSKKLLQKITEPILPFLRSLDLGPDDIKYVELIGGSIRMPKLQQMIGSLFPKSEVGTHINGDQAMALGSAFLAANSSKKYKVKGLQLYDGFHKFDVLATIRNLNPEIQQGEPNYINKSVKVFKKGQRFGLIKDVLLKAKQNVVIQFFAQYEDGTVQAIKRIKLLNITGYKKDYPQENPKLSLSIRTHSINIVDLVEAKLNIVRDQESAYFEQVKKVVNKKDKDNGSQQDDQKEEEDKNKQKSSDEQNEQQNNGQEQIKQKQKPKKKANKTKDEYETVRKTRMVPKTHSLKLKIQQQSLLSPIFNEKELQLKRSLLYKFQKQEGEERKLAETKNKLQALIYQSQQLISADWFKEYSTDDQISKIKEQIQTNEQKLDEQLDTQTFSQLYKQFNRLIDKIKIRRSEEEERDKIQKSVLESLQDYQDKYQRYVEANDWLPESSTKRFNEVLENTRNQIESAYQKLKGIKKTDDPVVLNKQILKLVDKVKEQYMSLSAIEKPKKIKKKEQEKQEKNQKFKEEDNEQQKQEEKKQEKKPTKKPSKKTDEDYLDEL